MSCVPRWVVSLCLLSTLASASAWAGTATLDISARDHSYNSGMGAGLDTGIDLVAGDRLRITVDPLAAWSAGAGCRTSNADGLTAGNPYGCIFPLFTTADGSFPYGTLVGRIGSGSFFRVGTTYDGTVTSSGRLSLFYWDSYTPDNSGLVTAAITSTHDTGCSIEVQLSDYNLFLLGDYSEGHDVQGKVAAGGNITLTDFSVGAGLPANDVANTLVAGGTLTLSRGGVWGDASYGSGYSSDTSVIFPRGTVSQGTPIGFTARFTQLRSLSSQLGGLAANGTTMRESWGGLMLRGTNAAVNVFQVNASSFSGAKLLSIDAPAGSLAVVNIHGASAGFSGFGISFSGGIDQHDVLYNFVDATSIDAHGFGFSGTVLAPYADISFNDGSWDGGIYAKSLTGNAEGHINALNSHVVECHIPPAQ